MFRFIKHIILDLFVLSTLIIMIIRDIRYTNITQKEEDDGVGEMIKKLRSSK
jgi:hypothetical protein